ncbi:hypothetical protein SAMN02910357_00210 [Succinivibrio dextrinosolvens]|uniref:hypothetical protein n=1 Tax=Succinivibrio dextrinosolvens TaxID=83771 RepID=UPI0008EDB41B|nr:hypothetical protein [Succinivibrio dextrinosolvens]SFS34097.1 hypothetical protein SAMN02910357_00210 [Succinivibrio dextrinosolvens]
MSTLTITQHVNRPTSNVHQSGLSLNHSLGGVEQKKYKNEFSEALAILSGSASPEALDELRREENEATLIDDYSVLLNSDKFAANNSDENSENSRLNTIKEKFAVLQEDPVSKDWEVLNNQTKPDDFSILDKLGDGLLAAAKFAAGVYLGKLF